MSSHALGFIGGSEAANYVDLDLRKREKNLTMILKGHHLHAEG